jgi:hypothetical protein
LRCLIGADEVGVTTGQRMWFEVGEQLLRPDPVLGGVLGWFPTGQDLDQEMAVADTECRLFDGDSCGSTVKVMNGYAAEVGRP